MAILPSGWLLKSFGSEVQTLPAAESYSPASVIAQYLIDKGIASAPPQLNWPIFVSILPTNPVNSLTAYDTDSVLDGRYMRSQKYVKHRGVQIRIRGSTYPTGYSKAVQIETALQQARRFQVAFMGETWRIDNISQYSDILSIGQEPETRRDVFVINTRCSLTLL